ncbi:hypothetical protein RHMOL_Rhmol13G0070800 [Rhododendron molle]|uniref:Uncharacterized protein n=1 Tax=Rhododendron molle TaxID=49168 RepID=A0ACC0L3W5_RHOML|nr:hypothetical protein RHMOL_Rhmol13G0070800 [Rhododendron molle]
MPIYFLIVGSPQGFGLALEDSVKLFLVLGIYIQSFQWGISNCKRGSIQSLLFKLSLSVSIYYIWRGINNRIFQHIGHDFTTVDKQIVNEVKACAVGRFLRLLKI